MRNALRSFRPDELGYLLSIGKFGGFEIAYRSGTADEEQIHQNSFENDIFFANTPEYQPEPNHVIIDIGAHIGTFALLAASKVPYGKVYAIEPSRETFNYLRINIALNHLQNVEPSHLALSNVKAKVFLYHGKRNWSHSIMKGLSGHGEEVQANTLANYIAEKGIERCDFLKFNCEGAEFPILLNTPPEVLNRIKMILIFYHCDLAEKYDLETLLRYLHKNGFSTKIRNQEDYRGCIVAERTDAVARP
jgi:FkbM family methyltransferase